MEGGKGDGCRGGRDVKHEKKRPGRGCFGGRGCPAAAKEIKGPIGPSVKRAVDLLAQTSRLSK